MARKRVRMKTEYNYLVITQSDTIDAKCSECSLAGINLHYCKNKSEIVRKIAEVSQYANCKVLGMYKLINKLIIDKDLRVNESEEE